MWYGMIVVLLFLGFLLLFQKIRWLELLSKLMKRTKQGMDEATRKRLLEERKKLLLMHREHTVWYRLEQELRYSGWKRHLTFLTVELWLLGNLVMIVLTFGAGIMITGDWKKAGIMVLLIAVTEYMLLWIGKLSEMRAVNENLLEFLNFLGNYSITAGEITGIFDQVSRYVDEPIKSALVECCYEVQTTGDASMALLSMAEKVEHPKFKELVRNMEVSVRYCADFTALVDSSRRSVREYLRLGEDRKGMLREAVINMVLLLGMSVFALITVDKLVEASMWKILFHTLPGQIVLSILAFILLLMVGQFHKINR